MQLDVCLVFSYINKDKLFLRTNIFFGQVKSNGWTDGHTERIMA